MIHQKAIINVTDAERINDSDHKQTKSLFNKPPTMHYCNDEHVHYIKVPYQLEVHEIYC